MADAPADPAPATPYDRDLLRSQMQILRRESAARAKLENDIVAEHAAEQEAARTEAEQKLTATRQKYAREIEAAKREYATVLQQVAGQAAAEQKKLDEQRKAFAATILRTFAAQDKQLKEDDQYEDASFREICKEKRKDPLRLYAKSEKELSRTLAQLDEADTKTVAALAGWRVAAPAEPADPPGADAAPAGADVLAQLEALRAAIVEQAQALCSLKVARTAFSSGTLGAAIVVPIVLALAAAGAAFLGVPGEMPLKLGIAGGAAAGIAALGIGLGLWLVARLRRQARTEAAEMRTRLADDIAKARTYHSAAGEFITKRRDEQARALEERFKRELTDRQAALQAKLDALVATREKQTADLETKYRAKVAEIVRKRDTNKDAADKKYPPRLAALETSCREDVERLERARDERLAAADARRDTRWREMTDRWREARTSTAAAYHEANRIDAAAFRPWDELADDAVALPVETPPGLRFGTQALSLQKVPGGVSARPELNAFGPVDWTQPALVPFPKQASLLVKTTADQKEVASEMMQALMLRIASGVPAGQTRFTIIDPLGLGKQFAGFMHLADHDELLVTSRIWTEPPQIEQRLADITEQMEVVIQKYLRNEYESIGAYNAIAEVP
ncbi:MAG: hypothetical protein ACKOB1_05925, partial [Planctomycetia bacterium]